MGKYDKYKDEIIQLRKEQNLSSDKIAEELTKRYASDDLSTSNLARHIRYVNYYMDSIVDESLHRNNLKSNSWKVSWIKDPESGTSTLVKNPDFKEEAVDYDLIRDEMIEEMSKLSPEIGKYKRNKSKDPHCLVLDIADLHIGKLATKNGSGNDYNTKIAINRAIDGSLSLIDKSSGYDIDQVVFVIGNDVLHIDNPKRTTTAGTPQDTDGMWYDNFKIARSVYSSIISKLTSIADVHVVHCPSNHDYMSGFMLADAISCYFHNNKNVTFDISNIHRKYFQYGKNMIAFSHGDGAKLEQVPYLAAHESKEMWAATDYRYAYLHHIHHKDYWKFRSGKDFTGMTVEYLRSPSGTDRWHKDNGFTGSKVAIEAFIHHPKKGQVCRLTHNF